MHILMIPAFFREKKRPTLGSFFFDQALALKKAGHEVTLLYCDTYSVKCGKDFLIYQEEDEVCEGIRIYRKKKFCPLKHGMEGYREAFSRGIRELYDTHCKQQKFDMIHAHCCVWAGYAAFQLSKKTKIPYVITEHATLFELHGDSVQGRNKQLITQSFQNAGEVICVSDAFRKLLSPYRKDIHVVGNVVDTELFVPAFREKNRECFTFFCVCYMQTKAQLHKKGIDVLLDSFKELVKEEKKVKLVIGGGGPAEVIVREWIDSRGLSEYVTMTGALPREEVVTGMQECDCFVLPSRYETFGVVYIEAFSCGKPVIAVKNGGPDTFVNPENGILIAPDSVSELTIAMKQMCHEHEKYDPVQIRKTVVSKFSGPAIAKKLEEIYNGMNHRI